MTNRRSRGSVARTLLRVAAFSVLMTALPSAAMARADAVLTWNDLAARSVVGSPFHQARLMSIVQLAVFEAVNAVTREYEPYLPVPIVAVDGASAEAAAVQAAYKVLTAYLTAPATVNALNAQRAASMATIPEGDAKNNGVLVGDAAAAAMITSRAADGVLPDAVSPPPGSTLAGVWQPTGGTCMAGLFYQWQDMMPFAIQRPSDFLLEPPPSLTSNRYAKDYFEVSTMGNAISGKRSEERGENARLYAGLSPSSLISMAARQIATAKGASLSENARSFALLMMSINDSLISSFYNKYHYNFWRPLTAIKAGLSDGNGKTEENTTFAPFIPTP